MEDGTSIDDDIIQYLPSLTILVCHESGNAHPILTATELSSLDVPAAEVQHSPMADPPLSLPTMNNIDGHAGDQQPVNNDCPNAGEQTI